MAAWLELGRNSVWYSIGGEGSVAARVESGDAGTEGSVPTIALR